MGNDAVKFSWMAWEASRLREAGLRLDGDAVTMILEPRLKTSACGAGGKKASGVDDSVRQVMGVRCQEIQHRQQSHQMLRDEMDRTTGGSTLADLPASRVLRVKEHYFCIKVSGDEKGLIRKAQISNAKKEMTG